ncbi:MAG: SPOR domain-containing protein [Bacteroidota bacterium]
MDRYERIRPFLRGATLLSLCLFISACAGSRETTDDASDPPPPVEEVGWSTLETFDEAPYVEDPPIIQTEVEHDVPDELMQGQVGRGTQTQVQGFRVQVLSTAVKSEADALYEQARSWWQQVSGGEDSRAVSGAGDLPIYIIYRQPYYRVRIGNFDSRAQAEDAQRYLASRFRGAFVVPDAVSVRR